MSKRLRPLAALAIVVLVGAGCSNGSSGNDNSGAVGSTGDGKATDRNQGVKFANCMRDNGVTEFPDPDPSGALTIDEIANHSSLDTSTAAWQNAIAACKDVQPPGFTGRERSAREQEYALQFAQCIRDNGVADFPDPAPDGPLVDTRRIPSAAGKGARSIPGLDAAMRTCGVVFSDELGLEGQ